MVSFGELGWIKQDQCTISDELETPVTYLDKLWNTHVRDISPRLSLTSIYFYAFNGSYIHVNTLQVQCMHAIKH